MPYLDNDMGDEHLMQSFISLARLFAYLEGNLAVPSYSQEPLERQKLVSYHADLSLDSHNQAAHEAQRVDLFVTRQWIRLLLWEYTAQHFIMSCYPDDQAFSLFLPVKIGREMLSLFSMVTSAAIKAHGYGMVSQQIDRCNIFAHVFGRNSKYSGLQMQCWTLLPARQALSVEMECSLALEIFWPLYPASCLLLAGGSPGFCTECMRGCHSWK